MNGKQYFRNCCKTMGIDCDKYFQLGECRGYVTERLKHNFDYRNRKESHLFAVCYVAKENLYVAWDLKAEKAAKKTCFSVKWFDNNLLMDNKIFCVQKSIEYQGRGEETVLAFKAELLSEFLEIYCGGGL